MSVSGKKLEDWYSEVDVTWDIVPCIEETE